MDLAITTLAIICLTFVDPVLGVQLQTMGMSDDNVGIAFAVMGLGFSFGAPTAGYLCGKMHKTWVLQIGLVLLGFSELLVGPSPLLGFQPYIWLMLIGLFFSEYFAAFNLIPVVPEIIEASNLRDKEII
jgi:predicted MFS family arabinose efflux permease